MQVIKLGFSKSPAEDRPDFRYCGRAWGGRPASPVANPCSARGKPCPVCRKTHLPAAGWTDEDIRQSVRCFRVWLHGRILAGDPTVLAFLRTVPDRAVLGCYCLDADDALAAPEMCHAVVVAKAARWLRGQSAPLPPGGGS